MKCSRCGKKLTAATHFKKFGSLFGPECIKKVQRELNTVDAKGHVQLGVDSLSNKRKVVLSYINWERVSEAFEPALKASIVSDIMTQTAEFWFKNLETESVDLTFEFIKKHIDLDDEYGTLIYKTEEKQALKLKDKFPYLNSFRKEVMNYLTIALKQNEIARNYYDGCSESTMILPTSFWMRNFIDYNSTTFKIADHWISR